MASGAAPCSDQRNSRDAHHCDRPPPPPPTQICAGGGRGRNGNGGGGGRVECENCVVCGDRACNHHYYGVAACHGCKCFFWRSIKNKMKYICRGEGDCEIGPNHRNACRFCRLQRCLKAGMQPEAVRMPKEAAGGEQSEEQRTLAKLEKGWLKATRDAEQLKRKWEAQASSPDAQCPLCHQPPVNKMPALEGINDQQSARGHECAELALEHFPLEFGGKEDGQMCVELVRKLVEIENGINEVADFSENEAPKRQLDLESLFEYPEFLDRFRTQVNYCVRLRRVTEEEMEFCKYRTLTKAVDYIRALSELEAKYLPAAGSAEFAYGNEWLTVQDKIVLLRHSFAPLALFDMASGTSFTTKDTQNLLCLPTGLTVCANEEIVPNGFLSQQIVGRCVSSLVRVLTELALDQEEFVMIKLIIVLAMDSSSNNGAPSSAAADIDDGFVNAKSNAPPHFPPSDLLSARAQRFVESLRDSAHSALYKHSPIRFCSPSSSSSTSSSSSSSSDAALRFAKLLHILPKLTLLSRDLVEHIRMVQTFPTARSRPTDPLFFQMFGDIFYENQAHRPIHRVEGVSSPPASASSSSAPPISPPQRGGTLLIVGGQPPMPSATAAADDQRQQRKPMISPPYKPEYGSPPAPNAPLPPSPPLPPHQQGPLPHHIEQIFFPLPTFFAPQPFNDDDDQHHQSLASGEMAKMNRSD